MKRSRNNRLAAKFHLTRWLILALAVVMALTAMGVGYAQMQGGLQNDGVVVTSGGGGPFTWVASNDDGGVTEISPYGDIDPGDIGGATKYDRWGEQSSDDPSEPQAMGVECARYDKDVARTTAWISGESREIMVLVENAYPSYYPTVFFGLRCPDSTPGIITSIDIDNPYEYELTVSTSGVYEGQPIPAGEEVVGAVHVHGEQAARQNHMYIFKVSISIKGDTGGGKENAICAKFITPDHSLDAGTQILPDPGGQRLVNFYVVASDPQGLDTIVRVDIDVYYDAGKTNKKFHETIMIGDPDWEVIPWTGLIDMDGDGAGDTSVQNALTQLDAQGRITYGATYDLDALLYDLEHGKQQMMRVTGEMDFHQPAQVYYVKASVTDEDGNTSHLQCSFEYLGIIALEIDFTQINWGTVNVGKISWVLGDSDMATSHSPTVRNIGNNPGQLKVQATPMVDGNNKEITGKFNVKMHGITEEFNAWEETVIKGAILEPCTPTQIDFSLTPPVGTQAGTYTGTMTLTIIPASTEP